MNISPCSDIVIDYPTVRRRGFEILYRKIGTGTGRRLRDCSKVMGNSKLKDHFLG